MITVTIIGVLVFCFVIAESILVKDDLFIALFKLFVPFLFFICAFFAIHDKYPQADKYIAHLILSIPWQGIAWIMPGFICGIIFSIKLVGEEKFMFEKVGILCIAPIILIIFGAFGWYTT